MKSIIVYYSHEGNTAAIAKQVAGHLGSDLLSLSVEKEYPNGKPQKFIWGKKIIHLESEPALKPYSFTAENYDLIIFGTPVWIGTYAPPIKTFLKNNLIENKKIALIACHGGGGAARTEKKLKKALPNNEFIASLSLVDPLQQADFSIVQKEVDAFCESVHQNF